MSKIHATAVIEDGAKIAETAEIGPFCWISSQAKIGENVRLMARVTVYGDTTIGDGTVVFPGACLGTGPQDHGNEFVPGAKVIIGKNNVIRENVTVHAGTPKEHQTTVVGDNCMLMVNSHVAHDCVVGNDVIMTNNSVIGGHVRLGDGVILGGNSAVHQFCRVGRKAMIGGLSGVDRDVIPFGIVTGDRGKLRGLNRIGMMRGGMDEATIKSVTHAFMYIFKGKEDTFDIRVQKAKEKFKDNELVLEQIRFIEDGLEGRRKVMTAEQFLPELSGYTSVWANRFNVYH